MDKGIILALLLIAAGMQFDLWVHTYTPVQQQVRACLVDSDGDGFYDVDDNCDFAPNHDQLDGDRDGVGDLCDICPHWYNPDQGSCRMSGGWVGKVGMV